MSDEIAAEFELNNVELDAEFELTNEDNIDATFEIYASGTVWGNIDGNIENQTDLAEALNSKQDVLTAGDNITIEDNVISATDTTYTAGNGISIENNVISNTQTSAEWGNIEGNLSDQTDLKDALDTLDGAIDSNHREITNISTTIQGYGDIVTYDASDFATNLQGQKADTALQPNDDITKLNNNAGYITSASLPTVNNSTITIQRNNITVGDFNLNQSNNETINISVPTQASDVNALPDTTTIENLTTTAQQDAINSGATTANIGQIATNTSNLNSLQTTVTNNYNTLDGRITSEVSALNTAITTENTQRQTADSNLQSQIDAIVSSSDVFDIVGTYSELEAYDISTVPVNDIIKVLIDSTHDNAATYYRCVENDNVKSWLYIGAEGAYYTKSESDNLFVDKSTTINGQDLSNNITLTASDVGALPSSTTIGSGILTIQNNGIDVDSFGANATSNKSINIVTPTKTSDLVNDSGFIDSSDLSNFATQTDLTNGLATKQDTISDLSIIRQNAQNGQSAYTTIQGYGDIVTYNASNFATSAQGSLADTALQQGDNISLLNNDAGYINGIGSNDVITALGYTPVNLSSLATVATTGDYDDLINKPVIDSELSTTSTNPVQNKVITQALQDIDVNLLIPVTYAELVELKTNSQLKEGAFYRITDYVTTTNGLALYNNIASSSRSAGHQFDIIIQALGTSNLSDIGTCALHEGDTYFANSNLGSWQVWYDINNDTNKYQWADTTNGKGVIYRMIDERFNDLPYDFKNIQFSRNVADYSELSEYLVASDNYYYTFSFIQNGEIVDNSVSGNVAMCNYNTIEYATAGSNNSRALNNIVIVGNATYQQCTGNYIGRGSWELTATEYFYSNNIHGGSTYNNVFKMFYMNNCSNFFYNNKLIISSAYNKLGSYFHDNTALSGTFAYNNIEDYCYSNTISGSITYNTIGSSFYQNTISSTNFQNNRIGNVVYNNTFTGGNTRKNFIVGDCYNNTFDTFYLNFIGYYFASNTVGANFGYNTVLDTIFSCTFGTGCQGNVLLGYDANISFPNSCRALVVGRFVVGSSATNKLDLTGIPTGATYQITILRDVNNLPVAKWQDNNLEVGLYKTSLTASNWSNLVTTLTVEEWDV